MLYQNLEAERACLGSCLLDNEAFLTTAESLVPDDFTDKRHKKIYSMMLKLLKEGTPVDLVTVTSKCFEEKDSGLIGGVSYLTLLINSVPTYKNIESYNNLLLKASLQRKQYDLLHKIAKQEIEIDDALVKLEGLVRTEVQSETLQDILESTLNNTLKGTDYQFRMNTLNKYLGGLDKGELLTIGGYTSQAKSSFAIQLAMDFAMKGKNVLFLSTEMLPQEISRRILGNMASVSVMNLRKGLLSETEREHLESISRQIGEEWQLNIRKISDITDVSKYVRKFKPEILFLDYIQNLSGDTDYRAATQNIKDLQSLTLKNEITTICVSQLSRNKEDLREPKLSDLRDTGRIEECSNMVLFIYWKNRLQQTNVQRLGGEKPEEIEILISKNRDGTIGRFYADFYPEFARIQDRGSNQEPEQETIF